MNVKKLTLTIMVATLIVLPFVFFFKLEKTAMIMGIIGFIIGSVLSNFYSFCKEEKRKQKKSIMSGSTKFIIHCSPGSNWYVGFIDPSGASRVLPTRKKWFGREWTLNNCPQYADDRLSLIISNGKEDITPEQALEWMVKVHTDVETVLKQVNKGSLIVPDLRFPFDLR